MQKTDCSPASPVSHWLRWTERASSALWVFIFSPTDKDDKNIIFCAVRLKLPNTWENICSDVCYTYYWMWCYGKRQTWTGQVWEIFVTHGLRDSKCSAPAPTSGQSMIRWVAPYFLCLLWSWESSDWVHRGHAQEKGAIGVLQRGQFLEVFISLCCFPTAKEAPSCGLCQSVIPRKETPFLMETERL